MNKQTEDFLNSSAAIDRGEARETRKHTPGPWQACKRTDGNMDVRCGSGTGLISQIAVCYDGTLCPEHGGTIEANARLIAACPDMLQALEDMIELCESYQAGHNSAIADRARAAIQKARGEG